jgi:murein DD-endopeptidase MepM/ murein hydrolase activator NlpD
MPAGSQRDRLGRAAGDALRAAGRAALGGILVILSAGCSSKAEPPPTTWQTIDAPVMTESLLLKPVDGGRLTSGYGVRYNPFSRRRQVHRGIDWAAPRGTAIRAAGDGVVAAVERQRGYGFYLRIDHGGTVETAYAHLDRFAPGLQPGKTVHQGDVVGKVGRSGRATGPHLHYEILVAGEQIDPFAFAAPEVAQAAQPVADGAEIGIGGPDIAADDAVDDGEPASSPETAVAAHAEVGPSSVIRVKDLLARVRR